MVLKNLNNLIEINTRNVSCEVTYPFFDIHTDLEIDGPCSLYMVTTSNDDQEDDDLWAVEFDVYITDRFIEEKVLKGFIRFNDALEFTTLMNVF